MRSQFAALLALLALAGCGGAPAAAPAATVPAVQDAGVPDAARRYVEALATYDPAAMRGMLDVAAPGSLAESYARVQIALLRATQEAGGEVGGEPDTVEVLDGAVSKCAPADQVESCLRYDAFELDGDRLAAFAVQGVPLAQSTRGPGGSAEVEGARVAVPATYRSVESGLLVVPLELTSAAAPAALVLEEAVYVDPQGRRVQALDYDGPLEVAAGGVGTHYLRFEADGGGRVEIPVTVGGARTAATLDT